MYVRYYMTESPITLTPENRVGEASALLKKHQIRHLPVVDREGRLMGMVTDRDVRSAFPSSVVDKTDKERMEKVEQTGVVDIMSPKTMVLRTVSTLDDAMLFFEKKNVGALPVLDEDEKVIGILSFKDLMRAWQSLFGLKEKGTFLIGLELESPDQPLSSLVRVLEENKIPFNRIIRTDGSGKEPPRIYLRVKTYNVLAVHNAVEQAGFNVHVPEEQK